MTRYVFLILPAFNRVYGKSAVELSRSELEIFGLTALGGRVTDIEQTEIGNVPYIAFSADRLSERDIAYLSNLSSLYALFEVAGELLRPLPLDPLDRFHSDLLSIQKYSGKTNEHFTKLLMNVTLLSRARPEEMLAGKLAVFDPMCGRGTTLNQTLMYGHDAYGLDIDKNDFDAYSAFIRTWLKNNRVKHQAETNQIRRDRAVLGRRLHITLGLTKELYKAGKTNTITVVNADTLKSRAFFRPRSFDAIVTDAPYGVQHGSRNPAGGLARSPLDLLRAAIPVWRELLRPGAALGISWNTYVARREQLAAVLDDAGLEVMDAEPYQQLAHRVDQSIVRDVIVARRP
jgi:hypothetical protein